MNQEPAPREEPIPRVSWREVLVHALLLIAILAIPFPSVFFGSEQISSADILYLLPPWNVHAPEGFERPQNPLALDPITAFRPDYALIDSVLDAGQWPLWNPLECTGVPLMANAQSALLYPPHLLRAFFPVDTTMTIFVILKLWICGMVAYGCARLLGLSSFGARFFSVVWMVGSYNFIWAPWPLPDVSAWLPVVVLGVEWITAGRYRRGIFAMALGATLMLFGGHPETAFTFGLGAGIYMVVRLAWTRKGDRAVGKALMAAAAAWSLAIGVYMVQLLPLAEYIAQSHTYAARLTEPKVMNAMEPSIAVTFWVPRFYGTMAEDTFWDKDKKNSNLASKQYAGMAPWAGLALAVAWAFSRSAGPRDKSRIAALAVASLVGLVIACKSLGLELVYKLPLFNSAQPVYYVCFALFAIPLAGAIGFEWWLAQPRKLSGLWPILTVAAVAFCIVYFVFSMDRGFITAAGHAPYVQKQLIVSVITACAVVGILAVYCFWPSRSFAWTALTVLTVADLLYAGRGLNTTMPQAQILPETELTRFLEAQEHPCRTGVSEAYIIDGVMPNYGIEEWGGYDGLYPERIIRYQQELGMDVWDKMEPFAAIQYYVNDPKFEPVFPLEKLLEEDRLTLAATCDGLDVYENSGAMRRAFLVPNLEVIPNVEELFARMKDPTYDPRRAVVTESGPQTYLPPSQRGESGEGETAILEYTPNRVRVQYTADRPSVLVLADAFYPGWYASVDGEPLELFPAYYAFRGAVVPAGSNVVEYTYRPLGFRFGIWISSLTLLGSGVYCAWDLFSRRRAAC